MKWTMREIVDSLPKNKSRVSSFWVKLIARRLSFLFTYIFINSGFSANFVSVLSGIVVLVGCILLAINNNSFMIAGVVLINLWIVLDCVDGNIARCKKQASYMGEFFDAVSGYAISAFSLLAIGIAAYNTSEFMSGKYNVWFIVIGAVGSITGIFARLIYQKYTNCRFMTEQKLGKPKEYIPENYSHYDPNAKVDFTYIRLRVDRQLGISGLFMPFLIASVIFKMFDIMVVFYSLYHIVSWLGIVVVFFVKAKQYEEKLKEGSEI